MNASTNDCDVVMLLDIRDVPEQFEADPFEDGINQEEEIVLLDVMRLDLDDIELL
jgi:hypothetical protein